MTSHVLCMWGREQKNNCITTKWNQSVFKVELDSVLQVFFIQLHIKFAEIIENISCEMVDVELNDIKLNFIKSLNSLCDSARILTQRQNWS